MEKIFEEFATKLIQNQQDLNPEFQKIVDKHFWDLLDSKTNEQIIEEVKSEDSGS